MKYIIAAACLASNLAMAQAPPIGQGGAAPSPPFINRGAHQYTAGPTPTLSGCGTDAVVTGGDVAGRVIIGTDYNGSACYVIFHDPWVNGVPPSGTQGAFVSCVYSFMNNTVTATVIFNAVSIYFNGGSPSVAPSTWVSFNWVCIGTRLPP